MYTGKLIMNNQEIDRICDFMSISKTLKLSRMLEEISQLLKKSLTLDNAFLIYEIAKLHDQTQVEITCEKCIHENADMASGSNDNSIRIWNVASGKCIHKLTGHSNYVRSLQLLSNNKLASGSFDKSINIWNIYSG